jgi:hypothetical protein
MSNTVPLFFCAFVLGFSLALIGQPHQRGDRASASRSAAVPSLLEREIPERLDLKNTTFFVAVHTVAHRLHFPYSLEYRPLANGGHNPDVGGITFDQGSNIRQVLTELATKAPGWRWRIDCGVVNLVHNRLDQDPGWPLNARHEYVRVSTDRRRISDHLTAYVPGLVPRKYGIIDPFEMRSRVWTEVKLQLRNADLRTALNQFVASPEYTSQGVNYSWHFYAEEGKTYRCEVQYVSMREPPVKLERP